MSVTEAYDALAVVLDQLEEVRYYADPAAQLDPPAAIVGPPVLAYAGAAGADPVNGQFVVLLVVAQDDRSLPRLWSLLPSVVGAIESVPDAVVTKAAPGTWRTGGVDLPCYEISVEMSLN